MRARAGQHTSLLEVTFADGLFRLASTRGASVHAAEDVVSAVLQLVSHHSLYSLREGACSKRYVLAMLLHGGEVRRGRH